jgi:translation initiation factor 2B subunit (eIF-2B alpha/beta/delta family)
MNTEAGQNLYNLIRAYMHALGTSRTTVVALKSYIDAIQRLNCTIEDFRPMLEQLNEVIKNTQPKLVPLVHSIEGLESEMASWGDASLDEAKKQAVEILTQKLKSFESATARVSQNCLDRIAPGDLIIAHSSTTYIRDALVRAHSELKYEFKVIVLKHDFIRTKALVNDLERHQVDHIVIPEYNLSHYLKSAHKLFIGAVSVTSDNQAVTGSGTANVVSLCHWYGVPVYMFVESVKFSRVALADQFIYNEEQDKAEADFIFHIKTFSHDFVDLAMVNHLITETGEIPRPAR